MTRRRQPNILITGTPGVGKSTMSRLLSEKTNFVWREVSKLAEEHNCLDEFDSEYQCPFLNEDKPKLNPYLRPCEPKWPNSKGKPYELVPNKTKTAFLKEGAQFSHLLLDIMEGMMAKGGNIVDYHGCEFFPERWFDGVFVIRTNNTVLYDRLTARGYIGKKLEDNIQCEIFETLLEEAQSSYKPELIKELQNNSEEQLHTNVNTIVEWIERWKEENM